MRRVAFAALSIALSACTCGTKARELKYSCVADSDCADDFTCVSGQCEQTGGVGGGAGGGAEPACVPGSPPRTCAISACDQRCQEDGGYDPCTPKFGLDLSRNPEHCGECGRACSTAFQGTLSCVAAHCTCASDSDCPQGQVCNASSLCTDVTEPCATVQCDAGTVCRAGSCAVTACEQGCAVGEVCELTTGLCRNIEPCRLPLECPDGGICEGSLKADGMPCSDRDPCTFGDVCTTGVCAGTSYSCPAVGPGQCQLSLVCAGDGGCNPLNAPEDTPCDDSNLCTHTDGCKSGACAGVTYVCAPNICASASACLGDAGCMTTPQNEGSVCDDLNPCSFDDHCNAGSCVGTVYSCPMPAACDLMIACTGDGGCLTTLKPDGATCDDGQVCTANDVCATNMCSGSTTTTYRDLDGDGRGDLNVSAMVCPAPAGYVQQGGDCNDSDPDIFSFVQNLVRDLDGDGRGAGAAMGQCVGDTMMVAGRTYYRDDSGAYTWLAAASALGADCDDADRDVYDALADAVTDADHDGYHADTPSTLCAGAASTVNGRVYYSNASGGAAILRAADALGSGECNDADPDVYRTVSVAGTDADQDGYVLPNTAGSQCVGASAMVGGRTYYASAQGLLTWLTGTALGTDCNDMNASVSGPFPWYLDSDTDTYGGATSMMSCAQPGAGYVTIGGDCNDSDPDVFQSGITVVPDDDRDGWQNGGSTASTTACVGVASMFSGRTYYRAANALDTWLASAMSLGDDCSNSNPNIFASTAAIVTDADHDGYYVGAPGTVCVGAAEVVNGRTYLHDGMGAPTYLAAAAALGGGECNDGDPDVYQTVTAATDVDQDGYIVSGSSMAQCVGASTTVGGRTYHADANAAFTRLAGTPLGNDCNDMNAAVSGPFPWYLDSDGDGTGGAMSMMSCMQPAAGYVVTTGDCEDGNPSIYRIVTVGLVPDGDRDGYKTLGSVSDTSECVGVSSTVGTRTYYRNASGQDTWLTTSQALGDDCDDGNASVLGPPSWYVDLDGDGVGSGGAVVSCSSPGGNYVASGTDCLDSPTGGGAFVYRNVAALWDDSDQDGYSDGALGQATRCVGASTPIAGRTYYRATTSNYTWTPTSFGTDCNDNNPTLFQVQSNVLNDDDNDGYPYPNDNAFSACAGAATSIAGRQYWVGPSGTADYLAKNDCIGRQGSNCPLLDCYDQNINARPGQIGYFPAHRGDGSFDYDCNLAVISSPSSGTYCASVSMQAFFSDAICSAGTGNANLCSGPTGYAGGSSAACGKYLVGSAGYYLPGGVCTAASRASGTIVGCH